MEQMKKKFLNTKEVAELLQVNEKMVYSLINSKGLPATKVTGKWLFPRRIVEEWLEINVVNSLISSDTMSSENGILLFAGSDDPFFQKILSLYHQNNTGSTAFFANIGSMGGLKSLRSGQCHIGVCHLLEDDNEEYNFQFADEELDRTPVFVNFSKREQGILVQRGNPKGIKTVADFVRNDISIVNRPLGTGTRLLLDYEVANSDISANEIKGYDKEVARHLDAGLEIIGGRADAAPAIRAVAGILNLDFIPIRWERFDLLISRERFFEKGIQDFLAILHDKEFAEIATSFLGYDISLSGKMIFPDNFKTEHEL
jgi:putative molybdopterin biosynthesis protein